MGATTYLKKEKARPNLPADLMQIYEGFNPWQTLSMLFQKHKEMAQNIKASPDFLESVSGEVMDVDQGRSVLVYTTNEPFHRDIEFVCWMFLTNKASHPFDILKYKYGINTRQK